MRKNMQKNETNQKDLSHFYCNLTELQQYY